MIFWGEPGDEKLTHQSVHDAIEAIIDGLHPVGFAEIGQITVHEFASMTAKVPHWSALESLLKSLDEEYANPDGDGTEPTEAMRAAEKAFTAAVLAEYKPWMCEATGSTVTVNALEWVKEHRPDWLQSREGR